jgi:predicted  nucleic acid-binding Zn-ribbon protein
MNKYTLVVALAAYAGYAHALSMSLEEGRTKVLETQARYDSVKEQLKKLDADIQAAHSKLSNLSISPSNAKEINALNGRVRDLINQRNQLNERYSKCLDDLRQALSHVGRKYDIRSHDGKYMVYPRQKNVRPIRSR